jgi:hypothetical protein
LLERNEVNNTTDILHEAKRLRLLAAALDLQHYTRTEANVMPIPGGDRVIAIGTPAQVAMLLRGLGDGVAELVDLLKGIRPRYGDVGTRDVDVAAQQQRIDRAVELLQAGAVRDRL